MIDWERLARAETHMLRISILEVLEIDGGRTLAPSEIAYELQTPLTGSTITQFICGKPGSSGLYTNARFGGR